MTDHLTNPHPEKFKRLIPGMASWAGWGPDGMTCRHCEDFISNGHYSRTSHHVGAPKDGKCRVTKRYYGREGASFSPHSAACNKFVEAEKPFPLKA